MINKIKYILLLIIISLAFSQIVSNVNSKITPDQKKMITQAKSLESSGLLDEAILAYNNILQKFPTLREAFIPLKKTSNKLLAVRGGGGILNSKIPPAAGFFSFKTKNTT